MPDAKPVVEPPGRHHNQGFRAAGRQRQPRATTSALAIHGGAQPGTERREIDHGKATAQLDGGAPDYGACRHHRSRGCFGTARLRFEPAGERLSRRGQPLLLELRPSGERWFGQQHEHRWHGQHSRHRRQHHAARQLRRPAELQLLRRVRRPDHRRSKLRLLRPRMWQRPVLRGRLLHLEHAARPVRPVKRSLRRHRQRL